ncbi:MAG TPA: methionyl-tRNA formyltransferase [Kiritimatiellae bacterium]|nr:methionyl-tRNA formyltransferase [Kiritimatiellia bacterium]
MTQYRETDRLRVVFWGSGLLGRAVLESILKCKVVELVAVVSKPDKPAGRRRKLRACPVKEFATAAGIEMHTPRSPRDEEKHLRRMAPDLGVVADYGSYLPPVVVELPRLGTINVHPSLLPRYRGAAPVQWALANGEKETGISILFVTPEMDAGDIILQERMPIDDDDDAVSLTEKLANQGAEAIVGVLNDFLRGRVTAVPQDHSQATFAPKLSKEHGKIDWRRPAMEIRNRIRGFQPWPGCYCFPEGRDGPLLHVRSARVVPFSGIPGEVVDINRDGPAIAAMGGAVRLLKVQPAGRRVMTGYEYVLGHDVATGDRWE